MTNHPKHYTTKCDICGSPRPKPPPPQKKEVRVKAWAVLSKRGSLIIVELTKKDAKSWDYDGIEEQKVLPCTISYHLPKGK